MMSRTQAARKLLRFAIGFSGILLILFLAIQLAPGGPVDRFFHGLYEKAIIRAGPSGPIR